MTKRTVPKITSKTPVGKDVDLDREVIVQDVRNRGGRPSLTGDAAASPRVSFRLTPEIRERAEHVAGQEGKTVSQLAREALEARVNGR